MSIRTVKGLGIQYYLWGDHPVHALGEVHGNEFHFQATAGHWEIHVTSNGKANLVQQGKTPVSGRMSQDEAAIIVEAFIRDYAATD